MSTPSSVTPGVRRAFAMTIGVTTLFVLLQAVTAGEFMNRALPKAPAQLWVHLHLVSGIVCLLAAVAAAVIAAVGLRGRGPLLPATVVLLVALVVQYGIGSAISRVHWLVAIHVPLAMLIFGLAIWLSIRSATLRRA